MNGHINQVERQAVIALHLKRYRSKAQVACFVCRRSKTVDEADGQCLQFSRTLIVGCAMHVAVKMIAVRMVMALPGRCLVRVRMVVAEQFAMVMQQETSGPAGIVTGLSIFPL